jgi:hypothetical protein
MPAARRLAACICLLLVPLLTGCGTSTAKEPSSAAFTRLAQAAQLAGIAEDNYSETNTRERRRMESKAFTPTVLRRAAIELPDGVQVVAYNRWTGFSGVGRCSDVPMSCTWFTGVANRMDMWQLCVADSAGRWLTYGQAIGVQASGQGDGPPECTYTGKHDAELDGVFDPRMFARAFYARVTHHGHIIYSRDPIRLGGSMLAKYGQTLPEGWRIPLFHQAGYTVLQYCLYAPDGRWFYAAWWRVLRYGSSVKCRLDPRLMHARE